MLLLMFMGIWIKTYVNVIWYWCSWMYRWFEMSTVTSIIPFVYSHRNWYSKEQSTMFFIYFILFLFYLLRYVLVWMLLLSEWVLENNLTLNLNLSRHHHLSLITCKTAKPEPKHNTTNNQNHIHSSSSLSHTQIHHNNPIQIKKKNKE